MDLANDIRNAKIRLAMDLGDDHVWFEATERSIDGPIINPDRRLIIEFMRRAQQKLPSTGCARMQSLGVHKGVVGKTMEFYPGVLEEDDNHASLTVRLVCYPEEKLFEARTPSVSRTTALLGMPEACNVTYTDSDFENFLHELQPYKTDILGEAEL